MSGGLKNSTELLDYVKILENRDNRTRGRQVELFLKGMGIDPVIQESALFQVRNIIVDFSAGTRGKILLFSAHYDALKGSPGANDNASGTAVLLGLCRKLKDARVPVRVVFFDGEEAWLRMPFLRLGLRGSLYYVCRNNPRDVAALYNLEYCGRGDFLCAWPVEDRNKNLPSLKAVEKAAAGLNIDFRLAHIPSLLFSGDHLPFRWRGLASAFTLTLLPASQIPAFEKMIASLRLLDLLKGRRPELPEPLSFVHSIKDTSAQLNESSLQRMLSVLMAIVKDYGPRLFV